ncbi:MAG TPA: hypothetical protein VMG12_29950 [Polyangiaceae bacterium]|nr:hypothetical protein [Polyangiaceae bacterium]
MSSDTGGRFSLQLQGHDPAQARYALTLSIPDAEWSADAAVALADGSIEFSPWQGAGAPPPWLVQYARAALRSTWHSHAELGWPRRLTRWRDAPTRSESA